MKQDSPRRFARRTFLRGAMATAPFLLAGPSLVRPDGVRASAIGAKTLGPSTSTEPYMVPSVPGVHLVSILTTGDSVDGYRMVGIPDGLGAFAGWRRDFTLIMNHELPATSGIVRGHGSKGAFVSRWTIDSKTLQVTRGDDFTQSPQDVFRWDVTTQAYVPGTTVWERHCSADLPRRSAFYHNGKGTLERIYLNGEEVSQGRAWARVVTGQHAGEAWQLPRFGRLAYENAVACPHAQDKTVVVLTDDGALSTAPVAASFPSEVYVYVGTKTRRGHPVEQAGLTNGTLYGLKVEVKGLPVPEESNEFGLGDATSGFVGQGRFSLFDLGNVSSLDGLALEQASITNGVTRFQRCEDGAWDPRRHHRDNYYFVTTANLTSNSRLWRLHFDDIERPERGGTIEILLKGAEGHGMLDNVSIDRWGRIVMDEDPGNSARIAKLWLYQIGTGAFMEIAHHNPKFFDPTAPTSPDFLTQDEESSGLIDASHILGRGWFLFDVQVHKLSSDAELVEGGQLLAMYVDPDIGRDERDEDDHRDDDEDDD